jgi:hypothetical protein
MTSVSYYFKTSTPPRTDAHYDSSLATPDVPSAFSAALLASWALVLVQAPSLVLDVLELVAPAVVAVVVVLGTGTGRSTLGSLDSSPSPLSASAIVGVVLLLLLLLLLSVWARPVLAADPPLIGEVTPGLAALGRMLVRILLPPAIPLGRIISITFIPLLRLSPPPLLLLLLLLLVLLLPLR